MGKDRRNTSRHHCSSSRPDESTSYRNYDAMEKRASTRSDTPPVNVAGMMAELHTLRKMVSTDSISHSRNHGPNWSGIKDNILISEFDPSNTNQDILDWLRKVDDCAKMYQWDDLTTMYLALSKLKGNARIWYDGLKSLQYSWNQWKEMLKCTFPSKHNFGKLFYEAASFKSNPYQDLNEYCFMKLAKLNKLRLNLTEEQSIDCIVEGICDVQIKLSVRAANCKTIAHLAEYLKNFPSSSAPNKDNNKSPKTHDNFKYPNSKLKCFLCNKIGHKQFQCKNFEKKEYRKYGKFGQNKSNSYQNKTAHKNVSFVGNNTKNKYNKTAKINGHVIKCFIDMGSECTIIKRSVADRIGLQLEISDKIIKLCGFNGSYVSSNLFCNVDITIEQATVNTKIVVVEDNAIVTDLLIGHTFTEHPSIYITKKGDKLNIFSLYPTNEIISDRFTLNYVDISQSNHSEISDFKCGNITNDQKEQLHKLLNQYKDRFCCEINKLGKTNAISMEIECETDKPVVYRPYRLSFSDREKVRSMIKELLESGIIRESNSPYASPILLVKKKDGSDRICVDFRALNRITRKDKYPLPLIDDQIDRLGGNKYFITLDLSSGFYQVPMSEGSIAKTGFVTPDGHYEFTRMPFGLTNAPSVFQRLMNNVLGDLRYKIALVYIDDIIIPAKTFQQGIERLTIVLNKFREHNLTLKLAKCSFFQTTIDYLGREISISGVRPGINKINAVKNMPIPKNIKQVRQFLGLAGYFRKFIKDFALLTQPLTKLLKKECPWEWTIEQNNAMQIIQNQLISRPILKIYDPNLPTEVHTDASKIGIGGILIQIENNSKHVVAYFSRQTTFFEQKYHSYELETLAVVESLRYFRVYLLGINFKLVTDCNAIRSTAVKRDVIPRIGRWWIELQDYNFDIEYRPGAKMAHVDCLSRNPTIESETKVVLSIVNISEADWLLAAQLQDEVIKNIRDILLTGEKNTHTQHYFQNYIIKEGKVHRKLEGGSKWLVPKSNKWQICKLCHDDMGHLGVDKTINKIKENYWFPGMRRFVKKYVNACLNCLYYKTPSGRKPGELHPIDKVTIPFHTIHIDHLGPFVKSNAGNTQLIVIVDGFSKFCIIEPVRNTKSKHAIKAIADLINIFGVPVRIISDRGTAFTSRLFESFCIENGIKHILNAVATPRANGQCERYNRTILSSLAALNGGSEENEWDKHVKTVQRGLNCTVNRVTGTTPSEVLFGSKPRGLTDAILLNELQDQLDRVDLQTLRKRVKERIDNDQYNQKQRFDLKRGKSKRYLVGDLVLVLKTDFPATGESKKLLPKYKGPYRIKKVLMNDRYEIEDLTKRRKSNRPTVVAVDKVKPWVTFGDEVNSIV